MLQVVGEVNNQQALLNALLADSQLAGKPFTREQLERRMAFVTGAGITDPDEFKRYVLSEDGA